LLRARQEYRQHAVAILGLDFVGIDLDWQVQRPTEAADGSLAAVAFRSAVRNAYPKRDAACLG